MSENQIKIKERTNLFTKMPNIDTTTKKKTFIRVYTDKLHTIVEKTWDKKKIVLNQKRDYDTKTILKAPKLMFKQPDSFQ